MRDELVAVGPLRAEMSSADRRLGIAFDGDDPPIAMVNELTTSDSAMRADGSRHRRAFVLRPEGVRALAHGLDAGAVASTAKLADERPFEEELRKHVADYGCKGMSTRLDTAKGSIITDMRLPALLLATLLTIPTQILVLKSGARLAVDKPGVSGRTGGGCSVPAARSTPSRPVGAPSH